MLFAIMCPLGILLGSGLYTAVAGSTAGELTTAVLTAIASGTRLGLPQPHARTHATHARTHGTHAHNARSRPVPTTQARLCTWPSSTFCWRNSKRPGTSTSSSSWYVYMYASLVLYGACVRAPLCWLCVTILRNNSHAQCQAVVGFAAMASLLFAFDHDHGGEDEDADHSHSR